ncbi:hypothetical protein [Tunturibacter empetritectus]|uniref:Uncharacterized protein n=1 Tax=Tunturiibacter lichenicola TaxID=2051959 RepID=A0A7W8N6A9_9BACT|nr:hypothetical protein [Edaphobacter lichenicola]MBB5344855.1 hypothetical protein [Edaphobacter lichenicola]
MNRRDFISSSAAIAIGLSFGTKQALAQTIVGVNEQEVLNSLQLQKCDLFCWAACLSTFFNFYGHPLDQMKIVLAMHGNTECKGDPTVSAVVAALNMTWVDDNGVSFTSHITSAIDHYRHVHTLTNRDIINELATGCPLFIATVQHAMVLYRAEYVDNPLWPDAVIPAIRVADPFPLFPQSHLLQGADITPVERGGNMLFCAAVSIA